MSRPEAEGQWGPTHHALLFAWIAREVLERVGPEVGEAALRKAARRYGEQRGRRMAQRALANGHKPTMLNYLAYGEWRAPAGEMLVTRVQSVPDAVTYATRCAWHQAWADNGLLPYGRLYCLEIDDALLRGFNPQLRLSVDGGLTKGVDHCQLIYYGANLNRLNSLVLAWRKARRPGMSAVMPWHYHVGHLYKTMREVLGQELGPAGHEAVDAALAEFSQRFGEESARRTAEHLDTDFDAAPR